MARGKWVALGVSLALFAIARGSDSDEKTFVDASGETEVVLRSLASTTDSPILDNKTGDTWFRPSASPELSQAALWKYPLDTVFGMSMYFYEIQRSGRLPADTRVPWRGDGLMKQGTTESLDGPHEGGYYDAGDHNKFMLPEAFAIGRLAWMTWAYKPTLRDTSFDASANVRWAKEATKWGADFLVRSVVTSDTGEAFLLHIGDVHKDHNYAGRVEDYPQIDRNLQYCKPGECSDVMGESAAALANAALAFSSMPSGGQNHGRLSARYWGYAKLVYRLSGAMEARTASDFGNSNDAYPFLKTYYTSTGVVSHMFWAAASMMTACKHIDRCGEDEEAMYRDHAERFGEMKEADGGQKWYWESASWDNAWWDGAMMMASQGIKGGQSNPTMFVDLLGSFAEKWTMGKAPTVVSPLGQRWMIKWGSNRYAVGGTAILLLWADLPDEMRSASIEAHYARCAAVKQIHYILGDNDRGSYIVGFGDNPPVRPHHRNACCSPAEQAEDPKRHCAQYWDDVVNPNNSCTGGSKADSQGRCSLKANRPNKYTAHGALIGGPKAPTDAGDPNTIPYSDSGWNDWRSDYVASEVTIDYNAHWSMALASAMALPTEFWKNHCDGAVNADLGLNKLAGLSRDTGSPPDDAGSFSDFAEFGWKRTLGLWQEDLPVMSVI